MTVVKSAYALSANNLYQTPHWATQRLIDIFPVAGLRVLDPCAGNHYMSDMLTINGADVTTADIETYTRRHDLAPFDFVEDGHALAGCFDAIIMNPPYGTQNRLASQFVRLALARCSGMVAALLTAKWDFGKTRFDLTRDNPRFMAKINLCDRCLWFDGPGSTEGTEDHAWFVWGRSDAQYRYPAPLLYFATKD